ncbi:MAG TPA: serine hydrolase domain-containing protein, partial [Acetobacteraceae bacterium]|nr:serine hydrolase domain-containing protein [Acetobacteraceae bacterium]
MDAAPGRHAIQALLDHHVAAGEVAGAVALVAQGDAVDVAAAGFRDLAARAPMRRDTIFRIMSMTKPITAAAAMILVEDGRIGLDAPVERWLPELASRRVLRAPDSPLDDTVPAERPITLEDLLTLRLGLGWLSSGAVGEAMTRLRVAPGPEPVPFSPDDYISRIGQLPLAAQPGRRWLYHTGADILCVLIARVAGMDLPDFLQARLFAPLGMQDTGFWVPPEKPDRLATCYARTPEGELAPWPTDETAPPVFPSELLSTAGDYLRFARMLL